MALLYGHLHPSHPQSSFFTPQLVFDNSSSNGATDKESHFKHCLSFKRTRALSLTLTGAAIDKIDGLIQEKTFLNDGRPFRLLPDQTNPIVAVNFRVFSQVEAEFLLVLLAQPTVDTAGIRPSKSNSTILTLKVTLSRQTGSHRSLFLDEAILLGNARLVSAGRRRRREQEFDVFFASLPCRQNPAYAPLLLFLSVCFHVKYSRDGNRKHRHTHTHKSSFERVTTRTEENRRRSSLNFVHEENRTNREC